MKHLSQSEYLATMGEPMRALSAEASPPFDFWDYFEATPSADFAGYDCSEGIVSYAWEDPLRKYQHVLVDSQDKNVFMVRVGHGETASLRSSSPQFE